MVTSKQKPLPVLLAQRKDEICNIFNITDSQSRKWKYNPTQWHSVFKDDPVLLNRLKEAMMECPEFITRQRVQAYTSEVLPYGIDGIKKIFIACMLWGYGPDSNGPKNTKLALSDPKIDDTLLHSVEFLQSHKIKEAYEEFDLKGCGPAFFTKFLYFVGKAYGTKPLPVISDSRVANYLEYLCEKERGFSLKFFKIKGRDKRGNVSYIGKYTSGYIDYINTLDVWANGIGCPADNIEYFLYLLDKKNRNNKHRQNKEEKMKNVTRVRDKKTKWLEDAKMYCANNGLSKEWEIIEDMPQPQNWNLAKGSSKSSGRPYWWFRRAYQGMFILMCESYKKTGWPSTKNSEDTSKEAADEYLTTAEGAKWLEVHAPNWLN